MLRKTFVVAAVGCAFLTAGPASAETQIGVHGGLNIPNIRGGDTELTQGYSSRRAPFFGLFTDVDLQQHLALRAELNYSSQGGKRNGRQPIPADQLAGAPLPPGTTLYADFDNETIIDYLEVPLMLKGHWGSAPRLYVNAGPYVGYRLRAKTVTSGTSQIYVDTKGTPLTLPPDNQQLPPVDFGSSTDVKSDINSFNFGVTGGVGVEIPFGPGAVTLEGRFSMGLTNIQANSENGKNQTGAVTLLLGYAYRLM